MAYITERFLRQKALDPVLESFATKTSSRTITSGAKKIFLCHSHHDKELAKGLKNYLYSLGIDLYVDWLDASMPINVNKGTAEILKRRIKDSDHLMVLATNRAISSRWVPWEIGIADENKSASGVSIIPVVDDTGKFEGNEYLQLYRQISLSDTCVVAVFEPGENKGYPLDFYLRKWIF